MFSFKKIIGVTAIAVFCLIGFATASAQINAQTPADFNKAVQDYKAQSSQPLNQTLPEIYILNATTSQKTYSAGDTVKGSFDIQNAHIAPSEGMYYTVSLVGDYTKQGLAMTPYDSKVFPLPSLAGNSTNKISFEYFLPKGLGGKGLGIQIQAITQAGLPLGWSDTKIVVTGATPFSVSNAKVVVGTSTVGIQAGPVVQEGQVVTLSMFVTNPVSGTAKVTPIISLRNRSIVNPIIGINKNPEVSVTHAGTSISVGISTTGLTPGVYAAYVQLADTSGAIVSPVIPVRFIVAGDIATIQSVTGYRLASDEKTIGVFVTYTGTPRDILTGNSSQYNAVIKVDLLDSAKHVIGTVGKSAAFSNNATTTMINVPTSPVTQNMQVQITVQKDGKTLTTYTAPLSVALSDSNQNNLWTILAPYLLGGLIAIGLIVLLLSRRKHISDKALLSILLLVAVAVPATIAYGFNITSWGHGYITFSTGEQYVVDSVNGSNGVNHPDWRDQNNIPYDQTIDYMPGGSAQNFTFSSPSLNQAFAVGSQMTVSFQTTVLSCLNTDNEINYNVQILDASGNVVNIRDANGNAVSCGSVVSCISGGHTYAGVPGQEEGITRGLQEAVGPFTLPTTPGQYYVKLYVKNQNPRPTGMFWGDVQGLQPFTIYADPKGSIDVIACGGIQGWTCDADSYSTPLQVKLYQNSDFNGGGQQVGSPFIASEARGDIATICGDSATHGFTLQPIKDGAAHTYYVNATNAGGGTFAPSLGLSVQGASRTLTCAPPAISASCSVSPSSGLTGSNFSWMTSNPTGGNGNYTYSWNGTDGLSGTSQGVNKTYSTAGTKTGSVTVSSPGSTSQTFACTNSASVSVVPAPISASCSVTPSTGAIGSTFVWSAANPTGGNGTYTYSWGGSEGLAGASQSISKAYDTAGTKTGSVAVTSGGVTQTFACTNSATVSPAPTAISSSCSVSPSTGVVGSAFNWSATNPTGGNGTYTYAWSGTDSLVGSSQSLNKTYSIAGPKFGSVVVASPGFASQTFACTNSATVSPAPSNLCLNGPIPSNAEVCSGTGNEAVNWSISGSGVGSASCPATGNVCKYYTTEGGGGPVEPGGNGGACYPTLAGSPAVVIQSAEINQQVVWVAEDGESHIWVGDGITGSPTGPTYSIRYPTIGQKHMSIKDTASGATTQCTVGVSGTQTFLPVVPNATYNEF